MEQTHDEGTTRGGGLAILVAIPAVLVAAAWLAWEIEPRGLAHVLTAVDWLGARLASLLVLLVLPALAVVLLFYPPAWPGLRVLARRWRSRLSFDRKAVRDLVQRLREFETAKDLLSLGQLYLDGGQPRLAVGPLARGLQLDPAQPRLHYQLARAFARLAMLDQAAQAAETALQLDPKVAFGDAWLVAAEIELRRGRDADALRLAGEHVRRFGESIRGLQLIARAAHRAGDRERRKQALTALLALPPGAGKRYLPEEALARARARVALTMGAQP